MGKTISWVHPNWNSENRFVLFCFQKGSFVNEKNRGGPGACDDRYLAGDLKTNCAIEVCHFEFLTLKIFCFA